MYLKKQLLPLLLLIYFTSPVFAASIPSIAHLDSVIQGSINSFCSYAKNVEGPVKYIACLNKQLSQLGSKKIPSIAHLDSVTQGSINSFCSYAKNVEGPVKYIACLNNQLEQLKTINIGNQEAEVTIQEEIPSYKDIKLSDALRAIENGESHKIWISLASEGLDNAQFILGVLYIKGLGVNKSMKEAANWINLARQNGSMEVSQEADEVWNEFELWKYE
jgi:hypothetical protein